LLDLEAAFDGESVLRLGGSGLGVQAIQEALYDIGYRLPASGADGQFRDETKAPVKKFQKEHPPLVDNGE
jgi:peptidoglycan hydrolase-like protein with peptidoglycan-binding domain